MQTRRAIVICTALVFAAEPVFAGLFGFLLAGDRLGAMGWAGCALILAGIVVSEPAAAGVLRRLVVSQDRNERQRRFSSTSRRSLR